LKELNKRVTLLNAVNKPPKSTKSENFRGLQNDLHVSLECEISLTYNISTPNGLTNLAPRKIVDIVYLDHQTPNKDLTLNDPPLEKARISIQYNEVYKYFDNY